MNSIKGRADREGQSLGLFIPLHTSLPRHPKTTRLMRALGVQRHEAVGHLACLWAWCMEYAQDGDLGAYEPGDIADAANWSGDPDQFLSALVKAGFIDREGENYYIHNWADYGGKVHASRRANADRQARHKAKLKASGEVTVTSPLANAPEKITGEQSTTDQITEHKITRENITPLYPPSGGTAPIGAHNFVSSSGAEFHTFRARWRSRFRLGGDDELNARRVWDRLRATEQEVGTLLDLITRIPSPRRGESKMNGDPSMWIEHVIDVIREYGRTGQPGRVEHPSNLLDSMTG